MTTKGGSTYIMTNKNNTTLYIGVSSDLAGRVWEHKEKIYPRSFTARYNQDKLVYFEHYDTIEEAIDREKQIKRYSRQKKIDLINKFNTEWRDLYNEILN